MKDNQIRRESVNVLKGVTSESNFRNYFCNTSLVRNITQVKKTTGARTGSQKGVRIDNKVNKELVTFGRIKARLSHMKNGENHMYSIKKIM